LDRDPCKGHAGRYRSYIRMISSLSLIVALGSSRSIPLFTRSRWVLGMSVGAPHRAPWWADGKQSDDCHDLCQRIAIMILWMGLGRPDKFRSRVLTSVLVCCGWIVTSPIRPATTACTQGRLQSLRSGASSSPLRRLQQPALATRASPQVWHPICRLLIRFRIILPERSQDPTSP
jgi:hypothetical protein